MKLLDKLIRDWRVKVALNHAPKQMVNVFDIGCDDGFLLKKLTSKTKRQDGCDPLLKTEAVSENSQLLNDSFLKLVEEDKIITTYDVIFALAVFEHFSENEIRRSAEAISKILSHDGVLIVTIPHPFVDHILDFLIKLRLIDGQAVDEHHGFDPENLNKYFSDSLLLIKKESFQFGLNNVFVFKRL